MRIIVNINRERKGNRRTKVVFRTFYDTDPADDLRLRNAGVELYNTWADALNSLSGDAVIRNEGLRKGC